MKASDLIYTSKELHATDWLGGRGKVAPIDVPKGARVRLFNYVLSAAVLMPSTQLVNAIGPLRKEEKIFEWLLNRINMNMEKAGSRCILISDEGKSYDKLLRRLRRFNFIPSRQGLWENGSISKNIPISRIIEDINYRDSAKSYFVQMVDFSAYALLRFEAPTSSAKKYGFDQSFKILEPICVKKAFGRDPKRLGIIRVN